MNISVVIPCRNAAHTIGETLESLARQDWPAAWEVIVADNGSDDNLTDVIDRYRSRIPTLRGVDASAKRGPSYARNVGVTMSVGEGILFCDADDIPAPGWAMAMAEALKTHAFVACRLDFETLNASWLRCARDQTQSSELQRFKFLPSLMLDREHWES